MITSKTGPYSPQDTAILTRDYPHTDDAQLAHRLGRSVSGLISKARALGLRKDPAYLARNPPAERTEPFTTAPNRVKFGRAPKHIAHYDGAELKPYNGRPGAMAAFDLPSRWGQQLRYRDGRVESLAPPA